MEILDQKCRFGRTTAETGDALGISGQTVKNHLTTVFRRLDVESTAECCFLYGREYPRGVDLVAMRSRDV